VRICPEAVHHTCNMLRAQLLRGFCVVVPGVLHVRSIPSNELPAASRSGCGLCPQRQRWHLNCFKIGEFTLLVWHAKHNHIVTSGGVVTVIAGRSLNSVPLSTTKHGGQVSRLCWSILAIPPAPARSVGTVMRQIGPIKLFSAVYRVTALVMPIQSLPRTFVCLARLPSCSHTSQRPQGGRARDKPTGFRDC